MGHYHRKQQGLSVFCSKETGILRCCSLVVVVAAALVIVVERDTLVSDVCCSRELIFTVASRKKMLSSVITPARFFVLCSDALCGLLFGAAEACLLVGASVSERNQNDVTFTVKQGRMQVLPTV